MLDKAKAEAVKESIRTAFAELEKRFIHKTTGLLLNYDISDGPEALPTPQEVYSGKPSHMSWNTPVEDGSYFSGLYLCALSDNRITQIIPEAKSAALRIAKGLISLSENDGAEGFVARNYIGNEKAS